ncbi:hypothetical protein NSTCB13_03879 [Nostoc sp. DSM 114160]
MKTMSDNKTDTPRNLFIVLILFIGLFIHLAKNKK